jgi:hypothetical protein
LEALGQACRSPARVYLVGGATAVTEGWRETTMDIDLRLVPDRDELLRAIQALKDELSINVELASPDQFIPELPGWADRSRFVGQFGALTVLHYDLYSQALAKLERSHQKDLGDVEAMVRAGHVDPRRLLSFLEQIEPELFRYPAVDSQTFRRSVEEFVDRMAQYGSRGSPQP